MLLLAVFIVIKVSPLYYACQYVPQLNGSAAREMQKISKTNSRHHILVKVDKSIVEEVSFRMVPEIKFSGVPFTFFFLASLLVSFIPGTKPGVAYWPVWDETYLAFRILRL